MLNELESAEAIPVDFELSANLHESRYPVIKIDFEGTILYANKAAFGLIKEWGCIASRKLPVTLLKDHPEFLDRKADIETELKGVNGTVRFNVVAFDEAGYTGLYGYEMK